MTAPDNERGIAMKHLVIMPEDCYKATTGRFAGCIVRKTKMGVELPASFNELRYIVSAFSPEAIEQAWKLHTCDVEISDKEFPVSISYRPKLQKFKIEEYAE